MATKKSTKRAAPKKTAVKDLAPRKASGVKAGRKAGGTQQEY